MKYFKVLFQTSSSSSHPLWDYISSNSDSFDEEDAKDLALEDNRWVESASSYRWESHEITEEEYNIGLKFNRYYQNGDAWRMYRENIFPLKEWAMQFADIDKPVRIGYPNNHLVYRMSVNKDGEKVLNYQYDYCASKFGVLKAFQKAYPV